MNMNMKKLVWSLLFVASMSMSLFTSCDKDDKEDTGVSGTYAGIINVLGENSNSTVTLTKAGDNYTLNLKNLEIAISLPEIGKQVIPIGNVQITGIVEKAGKLSGGKEVVINVTLPKVIQQITGEQEKVDVTVSLARGVVSGKLLDFDLLISNVPVLTTVPVAFTGAK
jgi:hypothetical protein